MSEFGENNEQELSPAEKRKRNRESRQRVLAERREAGEIAEKDFSKDRIKEFQLYDIPITREDLGKQALVLTRSTLEEIEYLEIVYANGEVKIFNSDDEEIGPDETVIIFPEDLGDTEE